MLSSDIRLDEPQMGQTKQQITDLLDALTLVQAQALKGTMNHPNLGICYHWKEALISLGYDHGNGTYAVLGHLAKKWEHTTGPGMLIADPVPHTQGYGLWQGPNLVMRQDLMRYLRKRLRDLRRRAKEA